MVVVIRRGRRKTAQTRAKEAVLAKCKVELYTRKEELSQDAVVRASEHVVTCMIAAGYRIDLTKESACYGSPTIAWCFIPQ